MIQAPEVSLHEGTHYYVGFMPDADKINQEVLAVYQQLRAEDFRKRTHHFGGRYENLYLHQDQVPAIAPIISQALCYAAELLKQPVDLLRCGFWINDMGPSESTSEHDHDENDELLSGVYYVQVPEGSGELIIVDQHSRTLVTPQAGMYVFFSPSVLHSVSMNQSDQRRISIGMNFGPMPDQV